MVKVPQHSQADKRLGPPPAQQGLGLVSTRARLRQSPFSNFILPCALQNPPYEKGISVRPFAPYASELSLLAAR